MAEFERMTMRSLLAFEDTMSEILFARPGASRDDMEIITQYTAAVNAGFLAAQSVRRVFSFYSTNIETVWADEGAKQKLHGELERRSEELRDVISKQGENMGKVSALMRSLGQDKFSVAKLAGLGALDTELRLIRFAALVQHCIFINDRSKLQETLNDYARFLSTQNLSHITGLSDPRDTIELCQQSLDLLNSKEKTKKYLDESLAVAASIVDSFLC
jgi:hypothetical protein